LTANGHLYTWGAGDETFNHQGLGYFSPQEQYRLTMVNPMAFEHARLGRWHDLYQDHMLAFAMGLHLQLGPAAAHYNIPEILLPMIHNMTRTTPLRGLSDAIFNLLGHHTTPR